VSLWAEAARSGADDAIYDHDARMCRAQKVGKRIVRGGLPKRHRRIILTESPEPHPTDSGPRRAHLSGGEMSGLSVMLEQGHAGRATLRHETTNRLAHPAR
jgi:hypothetical protein